MAEEPAWQQIREHPSNAEPPAEETSGKSDSPIPVLSCGTMYVSGGERPTVIVIPGYRRNASGILCASGFAPCYCTAYSGAGNFELDGITLE
jgi:hypothetical protein